MIETWNYCEHRAATFSHVYSTAVWRPGLWRSSSCNGWFKAQSFFHGDRSYLSPNCDHSNMIDNAYCVILQWVSSPVETTTMCFWCLQRLRDAIPSTVTEIRSTFNDINIDSLLLEFVVTESLCLVLSNVERSWANDSLHPWTESLSTTVDWPLQWCSCCWCDTNTLWCVNTHQQFLS